MPVLLASESAPTLYELLVLLKKQSGLDWTLAEPDAQTQAQQLKICGIGSLGQAGPSELSFLSNPKLRDQLHHTQAAAVFVQADDLAAMQQPAQFIAVVCDSPYFAYALVAQWFEQHRLQRLPQGIHPTAVIHPSAVIADGVHIGPYAVLEAQAQIGPGCRIDAGCYVGKAVQIGADTHLYPRAVLYRDTVVGARCIIHSGVVLGADGFGFAPHPDQSRQWVKIAQLGNVQIGNDVEIGANTTIDRGALDATIVHDGVKLDNQIMVGHNVSIGAHTAVAACVGIAGSTHIGARCIVGGAAMISGHLNIADDVQISGGTAITSSINQSSRYTGVYPYQQHKQWQRNAAVISQLSTLRKRVRDLERTLADQSVNTEK